MTGMGTAMIIAGMAINTAPATITIISACMAGMKAGTVRATPPPTLITMAMAMTIETAALIRLMSWLSPAFPVGGFNYSHGLEQAVAAELANDRETLKSWLEALTTRGDRERDPTRVRVRVTHRSVIPMQHGALAGGRVPRLR